MNSVKLTAGLAGLLGVIAIINYVNPKQVADYLGKAMNGYVGKEKPAIVERVKEGNLAKIADVLKLKEREDGR